MFRLLLLFTALPMAELVLLIWLKDRTSWTTTIGLVLVTGVVGASLARWQGWRALRRMEEDLSDGRLPAAAVADGVLILVAAAVLVTPGLLTDACGLALLVPPVRAWVRGRLARHWKGKFRVETFTPGGDRVVEGRVVRTDTEESGAEPREGSS